MLKPKSPQESFYGSYLYDRIVPVDHLLRKINQVVDFSFTGQILKDRYNPDIGRPAEDPEFMLRLCLLQYIYGDSDRQAVENARLNLAYKYFLGLAVDAKVPDYTTISYFRAQRLGEEKFRAVLEQIVRQCIDKGLAKGNRQIIDSTPIRANITYMDNQSERKVFFFRINDLTFNKTPEDIPDFMLTELKSIGINLKQDSHFSNLYLTEIKNKKKLLINRFYKDKKLIIQDKASYAVAHLLDPHPNDLILDMCAAPGIKTSIIAQLSQNRSRILANDFNTSRVTALNKFLSGLNVKNTHLINGDGITFPLRFHNYFDKILLDAPCTGSGTFSTNPELKWRQNKGFLHQNLTLQEKLLKSAIKMLKSSGVLVYSTCSLYPEEGELQILKILDQCKPMGLPKWFSPSYKINNRHLPGTGRLFPAIHHTKGFFIAKFKKK